MKRRKNVIKEGIKKEKYCRKMKRNS